MPKTFHVTAPDGHTLEITGPDDATEEQALAQAQAMYKPQAAPVDMAARREQSRQAFEANQPSLVGGFLSEAAKNAKKLGGIVMDTAPGAQTGMNDPAVQFVGAAAPGSAATEAMTLAEAAKNAPIVQGVKNILRPRTLTPAGALENAVSGPPQQVIREIEDKIGPSNANARILTQDVAPRLANDPVLAGAKPGADFDTKLTNKFNIAGQLQQRIAASIPAETPVPKQPLIDNLTALRDRFYNMGADEAVSAIDRRIQTIERIEGDSVPFQQFLENKQAFGNDLGKIGVFKRIAAGSASEKDYALSQAYGQYMKASSDISPLLAKANQDFSQLHDAMSAAGIDTQTGRRIGQIGQGPMAQVAKTCIEPPSSTMKTINAAGKIGLGLLGLGEAARFYREISGR